LFTNSQKKLQKMNMTREEKIKALQAIYQGKAGIEILEDNTEPVFTVWIGDAKTGYDCKEKGIHHTPEQHAIYWERARLAGHKLITFK